MLVTYLVEGYGGLDIVDVSDPSRPFSVANVMMMGLGREPDARGIAVAGNRAYVSNQGLQVFDISDPSAPQLLSSWSPTSLGRTFGVAINGNRAYLTAGNGGLYLLDIARLYPRLAPQIRSIAAGPHVLFQGEPGQALHLQRSPDLKTWEDWQTTNASGDWQEAVDAQAGSQPTRFYRIVVP